MNAAPPPQPNNNANPGGFQPFGQPPPQNGGFGFPPQNNPAAPTSNGLGVISLILGIIGLVLACCGVGWLLGIPAIICGAIQQKRNKNGMALAGLVMGIIATVIGLIAMFYWIANAELIVDTWRDAWEEAQNATVMLWSMIRK